MSNSINSDNKYEHEQWLVIVIHTGQLRLKDPDEEHRTCGVISEVCYDESFGPAACLWTES